MSDVNAGPDASENEQTGNAVTVTPETPDNAPGAQSNGNTDKPEGDGDGDTFPRAYVEGLRKESADHRTKAKAAEDRADALARKLHTALVKATNRLENPADLVFDAKHLEDSGQLDAALDALLEDRPYFAKRVVKGDAGQGARGSSAERATFADLLRR